MEIPIVTSESPVGEIDFLAGSMCLIDKEKDWTSFDVVNKLRACLRHKYGIKKIKVGHAGTLDPMATGLLIVCTGKATKTIESIQGQEKEYAGTVKIGATTPSYDAETDIERTFETNHITKEMIIAARDKYMGEIEQEPPMFSALKQNGVPLYKLARKGVTVERKKRKIYIYELDFEHYDLPDLSFMMKCSKGTYVRSFANDLGASLDSGGYLTALRRTAIGSYTVDRAQKVNELVDKINAL